ncbi:PEPxxWA-CTERM sorting domain-containing protein [Sphingosinicellaceae bacterium]|nr:PEPxxWA-CTERM sorting domain-containing protein [Sphingosinicellaceae bacterium]
MLKLITTAAFLGSASIASAATTLYTFDDAAYQSVFSFSPYASVVSGSLHNKYAAPTIAGVADATKYLAVLGGGQATFTQAIGNITTVSYDWGSIDRFNSVKAYSGDTLVSTIYGSAFPPATGDISSAATNKYVTLNYAASANITKLVFGSDTNSFELDNISVTAVPEPATWAMLIAGMAMTGATMRRRRGVTVVAS